MSGVWQLQEAKQRFSEVVRRSEDEGPQVVTRHGREVAVVVSADEYRRLARRGARKRDFKHFLLSPPFFEDDVIDLIHRPRDLPREIELE